MTRVFYSADAGRYTLRCCDHATGRSDVCAAITALVTSLAGYLTGVGERAKGSWSLDVARAEFTIETEDERIIGAWELAVFGLIQLANSFPDYIFVEKSL